MWLSLSISSHPLTRGDRPRQTQHCTSSLQFILVAPLAKCLERLHPPRSIRLVSRHTSPNAIHASRIAIIPAHGSLERVDRVLGTSHRAFARRHNARTPLDTRVEGGAACGGFSVRRARWYNRTARSCSPSSCALSASQQSTSGSSGEDFTRPRLITPRATGSGDVFARRSRRSQTFFFYFLFRSTDRSPVSGLRPGAARGRRAHFEARVAR